MYQKMKTARAGRGELLFLLISELLFYGVLVAPNPFAPKKFKNVLHFCLRSFFQGHVKVL